jgi:hypothetical protein
VDVDDNSPTIVVKLILKVLRVTIIEDWLLRFSRFIWNCASSLLRELHRAFNEAQGFLKQNNDEFTYCYDWIWKFVYDKNLSYLCIIDLNYTLRETDVYAKIDLKFIEYSSLCNANEFFFWKKSVP